jgi:glycosyltransferase involved in cell wall biosynthesis
MILDTPFPPDIRIEKEARSLTRKGYEVHLLCIGKKNETKIVQDIFVHRYILDKSSIYQRLIHAKPLINVFHINFWLKKLLTLHKKVNFSVFHCHDLSTALYTVLAGKKANIPVIVDMHENYPEAQKAYRSYSRKKISILSFFTYWLNRFLEKIVFLNAFHIFTVIKERKNQLINQRFDSSKISVLSNTVDIKYFLKIPIQSNIINKYKGKFVILYVGGFGVHRGLETLIKAIDLIKENIENLFLVLVGGKFLEISYLKKVCNQLEIEKFVEFIGWTNFDKIPSYITISEICIIPHKKNGHTDTTIPHKLFQYMLFGKPVISSDCAPLKRIIHETESGISVNSGDPKAIARAIITIYNNPNFSKKLGMNGKDAVLKRFNWEKSEQTLLKIYQRALIHSNQ